MYDSGLDTSLPTLERMAAAAKAKGLAQRLHLITDPAGLQMHLELWQSDARQRKSHLLQTGLVDWPALLREDAGQPLRLVLLTRLDDLADADRRWAALPTLVQHGPRLGYWFWLLGPARVPANLRTDHDRAQWQAWFQQGLAPHLLRLGLAQGSVQTLATWAAAPAVQLYQAFGKLQADGLDANQRAQALSNARRAAVLPV